MTSTTNITYLVKLTPLNHFFFGTEQGETADYYLSGNNFPQQTALLGLIRHQLLIQNNFIDTEQKIADKANAVNLIGEQGFQYNQPVSFGVIEKISPCFITDNNNKYYPSLPDFAYKVGTTSSQHFFPDYNPKSYYPLALKSDAGDRIYESNIFSIEERPGIDKPYSTAIKEKSYFKQLWLKLKNDFSFGFYVTIVKNKYPDALKLDDAFVTFGKEAMLFKMTIEEQNLILPTHAANANAIVLISDTYTSEDLLVNCQLAITDTVPFRNIINKTNQSGKEYFNKKPKDTNNARLQLLKKGSVLFSPNSLSTISLAIDTHTNFKTIGYNHYQQIKLELIP
jgi:CRISPR-associated protein Cmr3